MLALICVTDDNMPVFYAGKVKSMHWMTVFNQNIVGNIDDIVDGTKPDKAKPLLHPTG